MKYTDEFSNIDTPTKAYILGLLAADGSIAYNTSTGAYATTLKLKESDKPLLIEIMQLYPFFRMGKPEISKSGHVSYYIRHYSKALCTDLMGWTILPRKSYENANLVRLPKLNKTLFFAYIHGVFDGDGTIHQDPNGSIRIDLAGTNECLYLDIQKRLELLDIKSKVTYRKDKNYWTLRISSKTNIKPLIQQFAKTPLCLSRKFKPYFNADWDRIPGYDNIRKDYPRWFVSTATY